MSLRRARSIDELERIVAGHDLVLTADAPLALALNRRVDGPRLGSLAYTPRNYARQGLEVADRRELFHRVIRETDLSFKQAARTLDLALGAWEQTADREAILDWPAYRGPGTRAVLDILATEESAHSLREDVRVPESVDLAVVGIDGFSPLDRAVLPDEADAYRTVDPFEPGERFELAPFELLSSTAEIVQALEAHVTPANAGDVGVVLDPSGPMRPLVESMLDARSIPYHAEEELGEHRGLRSFLRALRVGLSRERLTGRDVRGLLVDLGLPAHLRHDERRIDRIDGSGVAELEALWDEAASGSIDRALTAFGDLADEDTRDVRELLEDLDLEGAPVTRPLLDALEFYLETYRVEHDYTREGVLLASGRDNAYVDRPLVFHLGVGTDWARQVPSHPWVTDEARARREEADLARFERLLQSGRRQVYLVQDTRRGKPVTPCFHLHELLDEDFERFAELDSRRRRAPEPTPDPAAAASEAADRRDARAPETTLAAGPTGHGFEHRPVEGADPEPVEPDTLSASSLDLLTYCPRDWYVDQLVPEPDAGPLEQGRLLHQFARAYASDPDAVDLDDPDQLEPLVELTLDAIDGLIDPDERAPRATEVEIGLRNVAAWLDENPPAGEPLDGYGEPPPDRREEQNPYAEHLGVEVDRSITERWFKDRALGVHGKVDLVHRPDRLVDWKSTRSADTITRTVRRARVSSDDTPHVLQPTVYLLHHARAVAGRDLAFTFVDLLDNRNDVVRGDDELGDVERTIPYHPRPFREHLATRDAFEFLCSTSNARKDVLEAVGYPAYRDYVANHEPPDLDTRTGVAESDFAEGLVDLCIEKRGAPSKSETQARRAVKKLVDLKKRTLFQEDLEALARHVETTLENLDGWLATRFPVGDDVDMDEVRHRDLILRDLDAHRPTRSAEVARDG